MLSNAGLNTHSNRTINVELKEDGKDPSFVRKIQSDLRNSSLTKQFVMHMRQSV
jgi:hypothetical protein